MAEKAVENYQEIVYYTLHIPNSILHVPGSTSHADEGILTATSGGEFLHPTQDGATSQLDVGTLGLSTHVYQ